MSDQRTTAFGDERDECVAIVTQHPYQLSLALMTEFCLRKSRANEPVNVFGIGLAG
jgi:hypothetical protein